MKILLIDDEPLALQRMQRLLKAHPLIEQLLVTSNPKEAINIIEDAKPDAVFLDIEMPGISGLEIAKQLRGLSVSTSIVFLTAHPEHALESYEYAAIDYLLKPVSIERLEQAIRRIQKSLLNSKEDHQLQQQISDKFICATLGNRTQRIFSSEIICCIAEDKYVRLVSMQGEFLLSQSLTQLESEYSCLLRVHRNALVNKNRIIALEVHQGKHFIQLKDYEPKLEVSRRKLSKILSFLKET